MKRSKKLIISLGAVLPMVGTLALSSCGKMAQASKPYEFKADADFRKAAFGNIGTINQVKNVVENSLQIPKDMPASMASDAGAAAMGSGTGATMPTTMADMNMMNKSSTTIREASGENGGTNPAGTGSGTESTSTGGTAETAAKPAAESSPKPAEQMFMGAWKQFRAIIDKMTDDEAKNKANEAIKTFKADFKTKFGELLKFGGDNMTALTNGSATLEQLNAARDSFVAKWKEVFTVYNTFGKALNQSVIFDTTKTLRELAQAGDGLKTFYKLNNVDVYNFSKPVAGDSYNDLARFFEALNGFLGTQFSNNSTPENVFKLFGNIMALLMDRELRIIDGAINAVQLTTPANNKAGVEAKLLANLNKNSTILARFNKATEVVKSVKDQTDMWAANAIIKKEGDAQSKLEMAIAKANPESAKTLTSLKDALYGNASNKNMFARNGLLKSVDSLNKTLQSAKSYVSSSYTSLDSFVSFYKMTNSTWMDGVGIFVNTRPIAGLDTTKIDALAPAANTDAMLFTEIKTQLKALIAATPSLTKVGDGQDVKSAFYLNQMVRTITSDNQARLASIGEGVDGFKNYANMTL
ncbi:hypothetical protein LNO75_00500 [Mycoplasma sp. T363T]|uniref:hypothetical protein n=1 Tax=Mycoplasma bradburyae TaxID=2963128 RepID=UPI002341D991|nr:hypothetical protein [Mycoplasma bradburyae]MDC4163061.1 hypothetical protein [Mycoplasma bradburyae]